MCRGTQQAASDGGGRGPSPPTFSRGQATVEMAILAPLLVLISMIAAAAAQYMAAAVQVRNVAREGAVMAVAYVTNASTSGNSQAQLNAYIQNTVVPNEGPFCSPAGTCTVTVSNNPANGALTAAPPTCSSCTSGIPLMKVTVSKTITIAAGFFPSMTVSYAAYAAIPQ